MQTMQRSYGTANVLIEALVGCTSRQKYYVYKKNVFKSLRKDVPEIMITPSFHFCLATVHSLAEDGYPIKEILTPLFQGFLGVILDPVLLVLIFSRMLKYVALLRLQNHRII